MEIPEDLLYTEEHEWVYVEGDTAIIGITDYAQGELGDVVFVELPQIGEHIQQMEPFGSIEAVKTVSDIFAPVSGEVIEVNSNLEENPQLINQDPYGEGWIIKIKMSDPKETEGLLTADEYQSMIE
ncbi:MAG: glycine cleavage system protein GcvH [Calditrichaeota bacterium]|nr:glycine cleavage system protein GcvH [Calditrichota bacterium]